MSVTTTTVSTPTRVPTVDRVPTQRGHGEPPASGHRPRGTRRGTAWFANRGVRTKIMQLLALVVVMVAATGTFAVMRLDDLAASTATVQEVNADVVTPLAVVHQEELKARMLVAQAGASLTETEEQRQAALDAIAATDADLQAAADAFEQGIGENVVEGWDDFVTGWAAWTQIRDDQLVPAALDNDQVTFGEVTQGEAKAALDGMIAGLETAEKTVAAYLESVADQAHAEARGRAPSCWSSCSSPAWRWSPPSAW
ncbi:MCP four helix bundle domain-containing protein [Cellulomonas sp. ES6]|uniref:MCP four helix bundle domain-containing protein n=1 Tax=Cellulomonas sp. ES6 TaxID=3039384 RepID=UPI0032D59174